MNITDALYRAAHNYPHGGLEALAVRLGISASSLAHKVKPGNLGAHCSPGELAQICEITGDHSAVHALAARLGYVLLPVPQLADGANADFVAGAAATIREFSEFMAEASDSMADGVVSDNEVRRIDKEWAEMITAGQHLIAHAHRLNQDGKPAADRHAGLRAA